MIRTFLILLLACKLNSLIDRVLSKEIQSFVREHQHDDPNDLRLKYKTIFDIPAGVVVDQILGRRKSKEKLPTWYASSRVIFPPSLNLEQSSSERTALEKIKLLRKQTDIAGGRILDLTGGFGVDSFFFSQVAKDVHFVEPNKSLLEIARHNHDALGSPNVHYYNYTAEDFLDSASNTKKFDVLYIDPARRSKDGLKVFSLQECEPDVIKLQHKIWQVTDILLIKTSPLLDIKLGLKELQNVKRVYVISVHNECKEILFYCEKSFSSEPAIEAINLDDKEYTLAFSFHEEEEAEVKYSDPLVYLYEPNASLLKAGAFKTIAAHFHIYKLHPNTHLYTANHLLPDFPGKVFRVEALAKSDPNELSDFFADSKANVLTRNYPLSVDVLRKKTRLKDGGQKFLIGCSGLKKKFLIVATKLDRL
jgi:16S rRNA G966 N2-methylase RsmD